MKIPKRINICGKTFTVTTDKTTDGASGDAGKLTIIIGTFTPGDVAENLIHEVGELIMAIRDFRYAPEKEELENADYRFLLSHADWQLFCKDMSIAMRGIKFPPEI